MAKKERQRPTGGMRSVTNALRVLDLIEEEAGLRVVDVAKELAVANSTAHRLLSTLRDSGYLRQESASGRYEAGPALIRLARRYNAEHNLVRLATQHLETLCANVDETVNLQVLAGREVWFLASIEDTHRLRVAQRAGTRSPAYASAGGKVLLARLTDDEIRDLYRSGIEPSTAHSIASVEELIATLRDVRAQGFAINRGELDDDVNAVAMGISDPDGTPIAAVSVAAPATRLPLARLRLALPHLRSTVDAIALELR
jgi:DNA-binding IclR family transcriptional regulator